MNVGDVLRVHTTLTKPPKHKIVLYVGHHAGADLFLWFNTNPRRERPAQMSVAPNEAPGITHNCFLDCGRVTTFTAYELERATRLGRASDLFLARVAQEIELRAITLVTGHRKKIVNAIETALSRWDRDG